MKENLAFASIATVVITFIAATAAFTVSTYEPGFRGAADIILGVIVIIIGLLVWFPVNLALWRASDRPRWLLVVLWVQAVPTAIVTLVPAAILFKVYYLPKIKFFLLRVLIFRWIWRRM